MNGSGGEVATPTPDGIDHCTRKATGIQECNGDSGFIGFRVVATRMLLRAEGGQCAHEAA